MSRQRTSAYPAWALMADRVLQLLPVSIARAHTTALAVTGRQNLTETRRLYHITNHDTSSEPLAIFKKWRRVEQVLGRRRHSSAAIPSPLLTTVRDSLNTRATAFPLVR